MHSVYCTCNEVDIENILVVCGYSIFYIWCPALFEYQVWSLCCDQGQGTLIFLLLVSSWV